MDLLILSEAKDDIQSIHDWYESKRPGLGFDFELCLESTFDRISLFPESHPKKILPTRLAILQHFPYGVYYREHDNSIVVLAVFNFKQNPKMIKKIISNRIRK